MKEIELTQNQVALIDDEDFEKVNQFKWCARWSLKTNSFYAIRGEDLCTIYMARFIMDCPDDMLVDHKSHLTLDNQKGNLRICTRSQNQQNCRKYTNGTSRYKGVSWYPRYQKWEAQIGLKDPFDQRYTKHLGRFGTEDEAAKVYDKAAKEEFGEFAYLNFPHRSTSIWSH